MSGRASGLPPSSTWPGSPRSPRDYYEAATIDGATGSQQFLEHHPAAASRPATVTVIILQPDRRAPLLRPHLGHDARRTGLHHRRHRVGDLQAVPGGLLRPLDRRQCRPVRPGRGDHRAALGFPQPARRSSDEAPIAAYWIGGAAILVSVFIFIVPFTFIAADGGEGPAAKPPSVEFSLPTRSLLGQPRRGDSRPATTWWSPPSSTRSILTVASVTLLVIFGAMVGYVLQRRPSHLDAGRQLLRPRRADHSAGSRTDHLGAAGARPVQDHAWHDPDRSRLRALVHACCCSAPSSRRSRANSTKLRSWMAPDRCGSSSRSSCRF